MALIQVTKKCDLRFHYVGPPGFIPLLDLSAPITYKKIIFNFLTC